MHYVNLLVCVCVEHESTSSWLWWEHGNQPASGAGKEKKKRKKRDAGKRRRCYLCQAPPLNIKKKTKGDCEESLETNQRTSMKPTERKGDQFFLVRVWHSGNSSHVSSASLASPSPTRADSLLFFVFFCNSRRLSRTHSCKTEKHSCSWGGCCWLGWVGWRGVFLWRKR